MSDLRERLINARISAHLVPGEVMRRADAEEAADKALAVFATWLRECSASARSNYGDTIPYSAVPFVAGRLAALADLISPTHDTEAR